MTFCQGLRREAQSKAFFYSIVFGQKIFVLANIKGDCIPHPSSAVTACVHICPVVIFREINKVQNDRSCSCLWSTSGIISSNNVLLDNKNLLFCMCTVVFQYISVEILSKNEEAAGEHGGTQR